MNDELVAVWAAASARVLPGDLGPRLAALCDEARRAHPALADDHALVTAIAVRAPVGGAGEADEEEDAGEDSEGGGSADAEDDGGAPAGEPGAEAEIDGYLARVRAGDLALALAAARGVPAAISELERAFHGVLDATCRRFASASHSADDLRQVLRERLFVAAGARRPRIADYNGQGFLENWLRVTAVRVFLDLHKRRDRTREQPADDDVMLALPQPGDLGLDLIKAEYRAAVASAMYEAASQLEPGDRHLLRQHLVEGLTIDQLGTVLGIHRATAARRIARASELLAATTKRLVATRLALSGSALDEVFGLVLSRLDVSLGRLLATPLPGPAV